MLKHRVIIIHLLIADQLKLQMNRKYIKLQMQSLSGM